MKRVLKRVLSLLLVLTLCCSNVVNIYADTPGNSAAGRVPVPHPGGGGGGGSYKAAPVFADYGFRVTITDTTQIADKFTPFEGTYTNDDLAAQRASVEEALKSVYIEPGNNGIYFYDGQFSVTPWYGIVSSYAGDGMLIKDQRIKMQESVVDDKSNELAWYCYPGIEGLDRTGSIQCDQNMYNALLNATNNYANGNDYMYHIKSMFMQHIGRTTDAEFKAYLIERLRAVISNGNSTAQNLRMFSWDTDLYDGVSANDKVLWSRIGYLTMLMQFGWLAQCLGEQTTYNEFVSKIWSYVQGGYSAATMPLLEVEACEQIGINGTKAEPSNCMLVDMPYVMNCAYGRDSVEWLYKGGWTGNMRDAMAQYIGMNAPVAGTKGWIGQGFGGYFAAGQFISADSDYRDRHYLDLLKPSSDQNASFGYLIAFTYAANIGDLHSSSDPNAMGSFTWKLDPNGVHDVTPDEEIDASSTVYNINMSQSGYNKNNYGDWESYVNGYGNDNNKIKVTIYRTSESLEKDQKAQKYERGQVVNGGTAVPDTVDRVVVVDDHTIHNIPVVGELGSGEESRELTNAELLEIIKTATGMSYNEEIVGSLEKGIRVTYAVRIQVKVGNKSWEDFDNNQAEYIEYRSTPGLYSYKSIAPDGYAEIKCGYFDKTRYEEPFEAMSGFPTTENLYFVSGGQEFVAQFQYEYTANKNAIREFEQKYSATQCAGYWTPCQKSWTDATIDEINTWLRAHTDAPSLTGEFITQSVCKECGQVHNNGIGAENIVSTSITGDITGSDKPTPGGYYTEIELHATHWDWHCDGDSDEHQTGNDPITGPTYTSCTTPSGDVSDSATQPPDETCDYNGSHHSSYYKVKATRYTGTIKSYHTDYNDNSECKTNQASLKWTQSYKGMNYAKIKEAHVWRLEKSRVEGIRQLTFAQDDFVLGDAADNLANVIFNVAENDNAKEGRMWYSIDPTDVDNYVGDHVIPTRGCCHCFNHNAATDLVKNADDPNKKFEQAWCVSDYLVLDGYRATTSLLYYQYETGNRDIPILSLRTSGETQDNMKDNGYFVKDETGKEYFRGYDDRGKQFAAQDITYTEANVANGTEEIVCANRETYTGGRVGSDDLSWAGYNGDYGQTSTELASGTDSPDEVGKYQGMAGRSNFKNKGQKKIFAQGYTHDHQGEVNDFSTSSPQRMEGLDDPFVLCVNNIDVDDFAVQNGVKEFHDSTIFYHNIISYGDAPDWSEDTDEVYKEPGFHVDTSYYGNNNINAVNVHDPVSAQDAKLIPLASDLDQRVYDFNITEDLNKETGKCPGKANTCKYAHINCEYAGDRYHSDSCYVTVKSQGLASLPVTGGQTSHMEEKTLVNHVTVDKTFGFTGKVQKFTAPGDGDYLLEVWGAAGGDGRSSVGGQGGYAKGYVHLTRGDVIYIFCGEAGKSLGTDNPWNGGGASSGVGIGGASGGGATDIRIGGKTNTDRVIVAGGGGGGSHYPDGLYGGVETSDSVDNDGCGGNATEECSSGGGGGAPGGAAGDDGCYGYGHGGANYIGGVTKGESVAGGNTGDGKARISCADATYNTSYFVPSIEGGYTFDNTQGEVIQMQYRPVEYTAPIAGYYSVHLYGAVGGGNKQGAASAGGLGGYAGGQIYLNKGETVLVTPGGSGGKGKVSNGYNGGGRADKGFGGGGATDVVKNYVHRNANQLNAFASGGIVVNNKLDLTRPGAQLNYTMEVTAGHMYRIDFIGSGFTGGDFGPPENQGDVGFYVTTETTQQAFIIPKKTGTMTIEFPGRDDLYISDMYIVDIADRIIIAAGGGGAADSTGTYNGTGDGRGGKGGGLDGENGYTDGASHYQNAGATAGAGFAYGVGGYAKKTAGAGGAGYFGGSGGATNTSGGGGGSSYVGSCQYAITKQGQNDKDGYALFILPGKGETEYIHKLTCNEPHHAPSSNWRRYTDGWTHEGGYLCTGTTCTWCDSNTPIIDPSGHKYEISDLNANGYIVKHDGVYHLTYGPDNHCDACDKDIKFDTYSMDGTTNQDCIWKATGYDTPCFDTRAATNPSFHYAYGDETCYDACMDDSKHKINTDLTAKNDQPATAGQFVILDHDFQIYFPDVGDFYGNGALAIRNTQRPEGWGYIDRMVTTPWIKEKYVSFPYDVTYMGTTYLAGEHIDLGYWDEGQKKWIDDDPDNFTYTFHCLLSNTEIAAAEVNFTVIAINTPNQDTLENNLENRNYTRYGSKYRAYHDASRNYFIDVVGRIGVLSMLDTGDFRFSNYYKQALDSWKVEEVVHNVDVSKQNNVSIDQKNIFNVPISEGTKGQNTWGLTDWMEPMDKLQPFPLTPGKNNVPALKNQAHRIGYSDYLSLVTTGNYYGENTKDSNNQYQVQIQPFYYHYNLKTKEWNPVDVYIKLGDQYKMINQYASNNSTTEYNYYYNLDWEAEKDRRMYTAKEEEATRNVQENWYTLWDEDSEAQHINIPHGITYLHGTANMLHLRDGNRTFIGSRYKEGVTTEQDNRIPDVNFNRQAQRWHFTLGLPSSAGFVIKGEAPAPANLKKLDMENGVIVCALRIYSKGTVWTLRYDGTPAGERSFYLFDRNTTKISWEDAGDKGPEDRKVIAVYTDHKTSRNDLLTEGSH